MTAATTVADVDVIKEQQYTMSDGSLVAATLPEPRLVGYAWVSTDDQDLSLQIDALTKQGIPETSIFMDNDIRC